MLVVGLITFGCGCGAQKSAGGAPVVHPAGNSGKIPVILDTDLGDDIDDTWALVMLLQSPEFDIRLITTSVGDTTARTKVVAKILQTAGRTDIPIGTGLPIGEMKRGHAQDGWVKDFDLSTYAGRIYPDGVQTMIDTIMKSKEPITLLAIGPLPNVAAALEREPHIARKARFVGMHGSVRVGYDQGKTQPDKEYNVEAFIKEAQKVFTAGWDITITPLDTCGIVVLRDDKYKKVLHSNNSLAKALMETYRVWSGNNLELTNLKSTVLFDTVAIYLAMRSDLVQIENLGIRVTDDGRMLIDEKAKKINCATKWKNLDAFENFLVERITNPVGVQNLVGGEPAVTPANSVKMPVILDTNTTHTVTQLTADASQGPGGPMEWVAIKDPGFVGQMSKHETSNAQYCQFLNAAMASGDLTVKGTLVKGANGSNKGADFVGQVYYNLGGAGYGYDGATNGGAARIKYRGGQFTVNSDFGNHPVTYASWHGATAFARYYGWRLPTEWEWQAVADYDGSYRYGCGKEINHGNANFRGSTHPHGTTPVGAFGSYGYGLADMAGNVWEWTSTANSNFSVHRGGSWYGFDTYCEVSSRFNNYPNDASYFSGFRVCR